MTPQVTLDKAKKNFGALIQFVDQEGDVYIVKNRRVYHLHRELSEEEAIEIGKQAQQEYKAGKTRSFEDFIKSEHPEYA